MSQGRPIQDLLQLQQEVGIATSGRYLFLMKEDGEYIVPLPSDTTAIWLPHPTEISMKDAYRPYDVLNTEFKNISMELADINVCEPDEPDSQDFFQELLIQDIRGNFPKGTLSDEPLLTDHEPDDIIPLGPELDQDTTA